MAINFKGIETITEPRPQFEEEGNLEAVERRQTPELIRKTIDNLIKTYLHFATKDNEGQQALIFKYDLETNMTGLPEEDQTEIENYIGETKSIKVLKITDRKAADSEFGWHHKAYELYQGIPDDQKHNYAGIPKPYINHSVNIDAGTRQRLNNQNAKISSEEDSASVMVMEWIDGEDLLAKMFRQYLADRPGYENAANNKLLDFKSLLIAVTGDFRTRGMDFADMDTLEQYQNLFKSISKKQEILTKEQQEQIQNTLDLLHHNKIYHNDLHLRNYLVEEETGKIYIIDFGRSGSKEKLIESDIKDELVLNFAKEYKVESPDFKNMQLKQALDADIKRIIERDSSFQTMFNFVKGRDTVDLIKFLETQSDQWRVDSWNVKKIAALVKSMEPIDATKAEIIRQFIKERSLKNNLPLESKQIIELI